MACTHAGLIASRSAVRLLATTKSCRFSTLKLRGHHTPEFRDLFNKANCPRLSSTRNLARLLNLMDNRIGVTPATCPRWDVMEDTRALYIIRDMSGLPNKDYLYQPTSRGFLYQTTFGCVRIGLTLPTLWFRVGRDGIGPGYLYPGYFIRIYIPKTIYRSGRDIVVMDVKDEVLKINIPKKKGKWTPNITIGATFIGLQNIMVNMINN